MGIENLDITKLLAEAGAEVDALIKTERDKLDALKKSEESSKEASMQKKEEMGKNKANGQVMKKEEGSKEESSMKKDEGSGYQNQAPEASASASADPSAAPQPPQDPSAAPAEGDGQDLQSMVGSLDDEMLNELMQVVQMEMETRQSQQPQEGSQSASAPTPPPAAPAPGPDMSKMQMAQKSEFEDTKNRLAKAEKQAQDLQKSLTSMTDLLDKMVNRPVQKAVTDVRQIDYIDKGEKDLKKAEVENISDADLKKRATEMSKDHKQLAALTKNERETLSDFFVNKKRTPEILKLVSNK